MDNIGESLDDDPEVEGEGPVLNVPDVFLNTTFHLPEFRGLTTEACHLCIAGDARLNLFILYN